MEFQTEPDTQESGGTYGQQMVPDLPAFQWLLVRLIQCIPIAGLVMTVIWAVGNVRPGKESLTNYARASLIWKAIQAAAAVLFWFLFLLVLSVMLAETNI